MREPSSEGSKKLHAYFCPVRLPASPQRCRNLAAVVVALATVTCSGGEADTPTAPVVSSLFTTNLLAWYKLDEVSGTTVLDSSPNGRHAVLSGATRVVSAKGRAVNFYVNGYVNAGNIPVADQLTIGMWVKLTAAASSSYERLIEKGAWSGNYSTESYRIYRLLNANEHRICGQTARAGVAATVCSGPLALNRWYHVALRYNGARTALDIDAELVGESTAVAGTLNQNSANVVIGANSNGTEQAHATVDDVAIYAEGHSDSRFLFREGLQSLEPAHGVKYYGMGQRLNTFDAEMMPGIRKVGMHPVLLSAYYYVIR